VNLKADIVTINRGVAQKVIGAFIVIAGLMAGLAAGGTGRGRLIGCFAVAAFGAVLISPTDRLKLDFAKRRYLRVYGWAPFVQFRAGTFDELEGISIRQATRGSVEASGRLSRVLFLNWSQDLPPFELASYDESRSYNMASESTAVEPGEDASGVIKGAEAADLCAEQYRLRFGFHRML